METSILTSVKKILGIAADNDAFDEDVIIHINSAFSTLTQLGVGPTTGFAIEDETAEWSDFSTDNAYNTVKTYIGLRVRQLFDPPATSFLIAAFNEQIRELEWRMNTNREDTGWTDPDPPLTEEEV